MIQKYGTKCPSPEVRKNTDRLLVAAAKCESTYHSHAGPGVDPTASANCPACLAPCSPISNHCMALGVGGSNQRHSNTKLLLLILFLRLRTEKRMDP